MKRKISQAAAALGRASKRAEIKRVGVKEYRRRRAEISRLGGIAARGKSGRPKSKPTETK
jgi:hypothetical protein